ncbi:hypothetical protein DV515_00007169 [Chloebia gouldiae]|uniref:Uncharacterized protein n=1 Tax=Chloebia gouldiae TaxID=44316 RepID=A0A3L8SJL7_CHLGU|nr:hypothetical protein DV515_00007169 [Chloebia gouldiae]
MAPKQHRDHAMSFSSSVIPCPVNESRADLQEKPGLAPAWRSSARSPLHAEAMQGMPNAAGSQTSRVAQCLLEVVLQDKSSDKAAWKALLSPFRNNGQKKSTSTHSLKFILG